MLGYPPLLLDLEAVQDTDHVLAVYRERGHWGAIAKSNFSSLRFRAPVYRSLRELVMSYFEGYINLRGDRTLRAYSRPVNLARFDRIHRGWMTTEGDLWWVAEHLLKIPHAPLLTPALIRHLSRVDRRSLDAGLVGYRDERRGPVAPGGRGAQGRARQMISARRRSQTWPTISASWAARRASASSNSSCGPSSSRSSP